ncbi:fluoride efflux transporter CrcB [Neobacillus notoginsengisoli]|uniref:Fluoride-specific ion channel FluC n=1 Tax=Neobacillus notoginsengisoli TaxID=1578198 RepID=A0A417YXW4_9BACI|nr:fluoride efflux transporter CrcB [Neobacillus notoginsengisoli]RHW42225.1 fluoride efflux transporter CrcB [Neobacillus notoginsengisoli]
MGYFYVGIGGAAGSLLRYLLSFLQTPDSLLPYGTLIVNLSGSFFLGYLTSRYKDKIKIPEYLYTAFTTGLIGSYTTFSTFCLEVIKLIESGHAVLSFLYLLISVAGGIVLAWYGLFVGRTGWKRREGVQG